MMPGEPRARLPEGIEVGHVLLGDRVGPQPVEDHDNDMDVPRGPRGLGERRCGTETGDRRGQQPKTAKPSHRETFFLSQTNPASAVKFGRHRIANV